MNQDDPIVEEFAPALARAAEHDLPPQIEAINQRHLTALYRLVTTMRAAGIDDEVVRGSVREIVSSYESELVDALTRLGAEGA